MKNIKSIFVIAIIAVSAFGFRQLTNNNTILSETEIELCCDSGGCDGQPCSYIATTSVGGGSPELDITCEQCVLQQDPRISNPDYCIDDDGGRLYNEERTDYQITFGSSGVSSDGYDLDGSGYGVSPGNYWLTIGSHSLGVKKYNDEDQEFVQWNDGNGSLWRTINVSGSATYYPIHQ